MSVKKYKDWRSWWDGLRTAALKAGATSVVTNLSVLMTTNAVSSMNIPGIQNVGENWKTFLIGLLFQFAIHTAYATALYVQNKPDADIVTVTEDTTHIKRDAETGVVTEAGSSKTTTITPVQPPPTSEIKP